jgi:hypothetical protein
LRHRQAQMLAVNIRIRSLNQFGAAGHEQMDCTRHRNHAQRLIRNIQHKDTAKRRRITVINDTGLWFLFPLLSYLPTTCKFYSLCINVI